MDQALAAQPDTHASPVLIEQADSNTLRVRAQMIEQRFYVDTIGVGFRAGPTVDLMRMFDWSIAQGREYMAIQRELGRRVKK